MMADLPDDDIEDEDEVPPVPSGLLSLVAGAEVHGQRIDRMLTAAVPGISRSRLQGLIKSGQVTLDGVAVTDPGTKVRRGQAMTVDLPLPVAAVPQGEDIPLTVVFEDRHLIVIDKPAGLVVHPAAGHGSGTLVNALIAHCGDSLSGIGGVKRPGIVHRLDKDTSGLLVAAKSDAAHAGLSEQFAAHGADGRLQRAYLALVWGVPPRTKGVVDAALSRSAQNRVKIAVVPEGAGRYAVTHYEVLEVFSDTEGAAVASLVRLNLETGRTHQIRVHMAHIGHPLLGDPVYGRGFQTRAARLGEDARAALANLGRQALHAAELGFAHPVTGKVLGFRSDMPADLAGLAAALRLGSGKPVPGQVRRGRSRRS